MSLERFADSPTPDSPSTPWATLAAGVNASITTFTLSTAWPWHSRYLVGAELGEVTAGFGTTTITVVRGAGATTHALGDGLFGVLTADGLANSPGPMTTEGDLVTLNSSLDVVRIPGSTYLSSTLPGADTEVLFNEDGSVGASPYHAWNSTTRNLTIGPSIDNVVPTALVTGSAAAFNEYFVVAVFADGSTTAGDPAYAVDVEDAPTALDATHYIDLSWSAVPGAIRYDVYAVFRDSTPTSVGLLGTTIGTTFRDDGLAGDGFVRYVGNSTGGLNLLALPFTLQSGYTDDIFTKLALTVDTSTSLRLTTRVTTEVKTQLLFDLYASPPVGETNVGITTGNFHATHDGAGTVTDLYADFGQINVTGGGHIVNGWGRDTWLYTFNGTADAYYGSAIHIDTSAAELTTLYANWVDAAGGKAVNPYAFWSDEQGVYRIKSDNTFDGVYQAIAALYNPRFTKYTAGAANHERIVQQWETDVATIRTEAGGTGTLRSLNLGGASVLANGVPIVTTTGSQALSNKTGAISQWTNDASYTTLAAVAGVGYALTSALAGYVPTTRTVNGHALSGNISVTASDVGLGSVENAAASALYQPIGSYLTAAGAAALSNKTGNISQWTNDSGYALLASPTFTGTPAAPTPTVGDNTTKLATTAYVLAAVAAGSSGVTSITGTANQIDASAATGAVTLSIPTNPIFSGTALTFPGALSIASGKTATISKTLTLTGTDSTTMTFPSTSATIARTDAANTFTGVQTMTSPALTTPAIATGAVITEAVGTSALVLTGNTQVTNFPLINGTQTWNASGVTFTADLINVTSTASAAASLLIDRQVGGVSKFKVNKAGDLTVTGAINATSDVITGFNVVASGHLRFGSGANFDVGNAGPIIANVPLSFHASNATGGTFDTSIKRAAAAVLAIEGSAGTGGALDFTEMTAPAAGATNHARLYAEDNGSGKTRLMVIFPTGAAVQLAIEP